MTQTRQTAVTSLYDGDKVMVSRTTHAVINSRKALWSVRQPIVATIMTLTGRNGVTKWFVTGTSVEDANETIVLGELQPTVGSNYRTMYIDQVIN